MVGLAVALNGLVGPASAAGPASPSAQTLSFDIKDFKLPNLTVPAGTRVRWTNRDVALHTSTSGKDGVWDGSGWDSPFLSQGESFGYRFDEQGTFPYTCRVHPSMNARVTVTAPLPPGESLPTPRPTATPFPELTVVPESEVTPPDPDGGVVSAVHPTSPTRVELPQHGVELSIPAPVQQRTFQVRLRVIDANAVPARPDTQVLRAVQIDLFDDSAVPLEGVRLWSSVTLSVRLSEGEVQELGGLGPVLNAYASGDLVLQKLSRSGAAWSDLRTSFNLATRTFAARISQFSTVALVRFVQPAEQGAVATASPTPTPTATPPAVAPDTGDAGLSGAQVLAAAVVGGSFVLSGRGGRARSRTET